ncbi:MAG TPA: ATP-binding cassette domain-containing protein [Spirochaetota bacterium]|nr:ATP-binding cassette domain-containing protein [Spirochaetota bacterium]HPJ33451.1 ATP-binding cassette domain-containing protein [Spirochaetota bacterium]
MNKTPLYELKDIKHTYNRFMLRIPELIIERGDSIGLAGPNGSGKSTLMRLLALLEEPAHGSVAFHPSGERKTSVTMLQQDPYLLKRSVYDNVSYGLKIRKDRRSLRERVAESLDLVNLDPAKFMHRSWYELSGGEAQRVALASRIILKPDALLLDEPVANVDTESSYAISEAVKKMREMHSTTLIISSHDISWLNNITDKVLKLHNGRITGAGNINILPGPWIKGEKGLWQYTLPEGYSVYATEPPEPDSIGILHPHEIIISDRKVKNISAVNKVPATVKLMVKEEKTGSIRVEADASGRIINIEITEESAKKMQIIPGKKIFLIFKATSVIWH